MFGDLAVALAGRMRVIRWDQRGCGRSDRRGPYSLARTVRDLDAVRQHHGLDRMAVLGHSWGATVALRYALDHPSRVSKLVYVSGTGLGQDWHPRYQQNLAARLGPELSRLHDRERAVLQWTADFADPGKAMGFAEQMADPWFEINYEWTRWSGPCRRRSGSCCPTSATCPGWKHPTSSVRCCWTTCAAVILGDRG